MTRLTCRVAVIGVVVALALTIAGCGGQRLISQDEEIKMGREAATEFERSNGGAETSGQRLQIAKEIGGRVGAAASRSPYPDYPYEYRVLNNKQVNANAFPGGIIYLWRGLYETLGNDRDQLAWVASHEAAHVARQHSVRRIERSLGYEMVIELVLGGDTAGQIASAVAGLTLQDYGRDQELEADRVGLDFAKTAGYDPTAALAVVAAFKKIQGKDPNQLELLFSTHPGNTEREDNIKAYLDQKGWTGKYHQ